MLGSDSSSSRLSPAPGDPVPSPSWAPGAAGTRWGRGKAGCEGPHARVALPQGPLRLPLSLEGWGLLRLCGQPATLQRPSQHVGTCPLWPGENPSLCPQDLPSPLRWLQVPASLVSPVPRGRSRCSYCWGLSLWAGGGAWRVSPSRVSFDKRRWCPSPASEAHSPAAVFLPGQPLPHKPPAPRATPGGTC